MSNEVSQVGESLLGFSKAELSMPYGETLTGLPSEAPWLTPLGVGLVVIFAVRRADDGHVEFGIGNQAPPILAWVRKESFHNEWPD